MKTKGKLGIFFANYRFNSMFFKIFLLILALIFVPLSGASILAYYTYNNMRQNQTEAYQERVNLELYTKLEKIIKEAESQLIHIGFNTNVEMFMYDTEELKQLNYKIANIQELLMFPVITKNYVRNVYVYSAENHKVISMYGATDFDSCIDRQCLETYLNSEEENRSVMGTTGWKHGYAENQLSIFHEIRYGEAYSGLAVMNLDMEALQKELGIPKDVDVCLVRNGKIVFSDREEMTGQKLEVVMSESQEQGNTFEKSSDDGKLQVVTFYAEDGYEDSLSTVRNAMMLFLLLMGMLTLLLSAVISARLFRPIESIISEIQKNKDTLIGENELFREKDELEYILSSIRRTANLKKDIDEELSERVKLLKKAQAVALQSQINPHFLNNTLDSINWIAIGLLGGRNEISEMTTALSRMLRMTLENTDSIIPISQEIEHCMYYLEIQNRRYEDKFRVIWKVPEEIYYCKTIRVVLQPIVENAIYHGMKHLSNRGKIVISGNLEDDVVELIVEDNGLGMTKEELESLRENMKSQVIKESRHIGVANVNQRIRLYFGEEYGVLIDSTEGVGTRVTIRMPKIGREKI